MAGVNPYTECERGVSIMKEYMTKQEYEQTLRSLVDAKGRLVQAQEAYDRQFFAMFDQSTLFPKEVTK